MKIPTEMNHSGFDAMVGFCQRHGISSLDAQKEKEKLMQKSIIRAALQCISLHMEIIHKTIEIKIWKSWEMNFMAVWWLVTYQSPCSPAQKKYNLMLAQSVVPNWAHC